MPRLKGNSPCQGECHECDEGVPVSGGKGGCDQREQTERSPKQRRRRWDSFCLNKGFYGTKRAALAPLSHFVTALLSGEPKSYSVKSQKKCFQAVPFRGKWLRHSRRRKGLFRMQNAECKVQN